MRISAGARRLLIRSGVAKLLYRSEAVKRFYRRWIRDRLGDQPNNYNIQLSSICNALCVFCTYPQLKESGTPQLHISDDSFDRAIELIRKQPRPIVCFTPTTGEVLVNSRWAERVQTALDLPFVREVYFYSNAISLNRKNIDRLLGLKNREKLRVNFSTGGTDRELYHAMYGVDRFDKVARNINALFEVLAERGESVPVGVDVKLRPGDRVSNDLLEKTYNKAGYRYAQFIQSNELSDLGGVVAGEFTIRYKLQARDNRPCHGLGNFRFAANGDIWLCGCAFSEPPGSTELRVGHAKGWADLAAAEEHQRTLADAWRDHNDVPEPCKHCPIYQPEPASAARERRSAPLPPADRPVRLPVLNH